MRRGAIGLGLAAVSMAMAPAAAAAAPFDFVCGAPFGEHSEVRQERTGPPYRVRGRIHPVALAEILPRPRREDLPIGMPVRNMRGAVVEIMDWSEGIHAWLEVAPGDRSGEAYEVSLNWRAGERHHARVLARLARPGPGLPFDPIHYEIAADGRRVTVEAAGARAEIALAIGVPGGVRLRCSGGAFFFDDADWGEGAPR